MKHKGSKPARAIAALFCALSLLLTACGPGSGDGAGTKTADAMIDWKELTDPRGIYPKGGEVTGKTNPKIADMTYKTNDVVVADIIPTEMGYAVDPTGASDSTDGIQQALYDCFNAGGGTVFLPVGNYVITDTVYVPSFVTLHGDWQDPDKGSDYGTIFSVWQGPSDQKVGGAFMVGGSAGIVGITVYYPFQTMYEVLPYPCTFYIEDDGMLVTLRNITVINGYRGIGTSYEIPHECLIIDNFKGTFLNYGMELYNQSDVGTVDNVVFSGKYWKQATAECMNKPAPELLDTYIKENATGMILGDLEWTNFGRVTIDGYSTGLRFVLGYRYHFAGSMIDMNIINCKRGYLLEDGDKRWGMVVARSTIEGGIANAWIGMVRLADSKVTGDISEVKPGSIEQNKADLSGYKVDYDTSYVKPREKLLVTDLPRGLTQDVSGELQKALDEMGASGGGIVYVPGGVYRFDNPVSVPAGVQLRGAASVATRELLMNCQGTLFMCYYGDDEDNNPETDAALITLAGKNAGISGVRILYPENGPKDKNLNSTYTIRGTAAGVYAVNCFIAASGYGVDFKDCDNHYIKGLYTCAYYNAVRVGGKNGIFKGSLNNPSMIVRTLAKGIVDWVQIDEPFEVLIDPVTRQYTRAYIVDGAENQLIYNVFSYGSLYHITNKNSAGTLCVNIGSDNLNDNGAQLVNESSDMTVINSLRYNGHSYDNTDGKLNLYNRISVDETDEKIEIIDGRKK